MNKLLNNKYFLIGLGIVAVGGLIFVMVSATKNVPESAPVPTQAPLQPKTAKFSPPVKDKPVTGQIIVKFKPQYTQAQINEHLKQYNASILKTIEGINQTVVKVPAGQEETIMNQLQSDPYVQTAQRDYTTHAFFTPNDPGFSLQYALNNTGQAILGHTGKAQADIRAETAWDVTKGNGIKVAILDTGINLNQPDLAGKVVAGKFYTSGTPTSIEDGNGHGTHVAGIIAADTNNSVGVAGVCPGCQLIIVKVLDDSGNGTTSDAVSGITWAADQGAKVINMSLGTTDSSTESLYAQAVSYAQSKGAVVVAAAGNDGTTQLNYPAAVPGVISVAATTNTDQKASYSNYGSSVALAAPGDNILSTGPTHSFDLEPFGYDFSSPYMYLSGTSMAAPVVSGVAALVASTSFGTSPQAVMNRLYTTADKISGTGTYWVNGRVDAAAAVGPAPTPNLAPTSSLITPTLYCVGGNGTPPCATIPAGSPSIAIVSPASSGGTNPSTDITSPASGGGENPSVSPDVSVSPSVSSAPGNPGTGSGPACTQITNVFYNLASTKTQSNISKVHIKCEPSKGGSGNSGGGNTTNPHNGWLSQLFQFLLQLLQLLLQLIANCTNNPTTGTTSPSTAPISIFPSPSISEAAPSVSPISPTPSVTIISPATGASISPSTSSSSFTNPTISQDFTPWSGTKSPDGLWQINGNWVGTGGNLLETSNAKLATTTSGASNGSLSLTTLANTKDGAEIQTIKGYSYGYYETRMKVTSTPGVVASFFWKEVNYAFAEIDFEFLTNESWISSTNNGVVHLSIDGGTSTPVDLPFNPSKGFHTYGFLFQPGNVQFDADGQVLKTLTIPSSHASDYAQLGYIMMNTWTGDPNWGGGPPTQDATSIYDWVKYNANATSIPH